MYKIKDKYVSRHLDASGGLEKLNVKQRRKFSRDGREGTQPMRPGYSSRKGWNKNQPLRLELIPAAWAGIKTRPCGWRKPGDGISSRRMLDVREKLGKGGEKNTRRTDKSIHVTEITRPWKRIRTNQFNEYTHTQCAMYPINTDECIRLNEGG